MLNTIEVEKRTQQVKAVDFHVHEVNMFTWFLKMPGSQCFVCIRRPFRIHNIIGRCPQNCFRPNSEVGANLVPPKKVSRTKCEHANKEKFLPVL